MRGNEEGLCKIYIFLFIKNFCSKIQYYKLLVNLVMLGEENISCIRDNLIRSSTRRVHNNHIKVLKQIGRDQRLNMIATRIGTTKATGRQRGRAEKRNGKWTPRHFIKIIKF